MKQDIRKLFRDDDVTYKKLPENHRLEFIERLKGSTNKKTRKRPIGILIKVAASIAILFSAYYIFLDENTQQQKRPTALEIQVQEIEQKYLQEIDNEWQQLLKITSDEQLITRFEKELSELQNDYLNISKEFRNNPNSITIIEELIDNLKTRLQLLKNIRSHINFINKETEHNENATI